MLFKKNNLIDKIARGDIFSRRMRIDAQEEARVLSVSEDTQGIPHVHYEKTLVAGGYKDPQGERVLCLDVFAKDFRVA